MPVSGVDHVNILTDDLEKTASFYEQVLGLTRSDNPTIAMGIAGYWMRDGQGSAIVHLVDRTTAGDRYEAYRPGQPTNALHHFALRCTGFAETAAKIEELGLAHRVSDHPKLGLRQIFLVDPNAVNLELNFPGD
ncbi:catechol 2,3-dioxygenase-like lactoylglutathione lyase family enzyme [Novosphingobium sp. PhB57]|jgi:catechol 2,3-dioxygenase-like lactoylglutathione lyase family enzyme|uniref:VOC family protein n=1 Tax=unclassified Novosphingobium TaxID=2644732 RepID=UPI00104B1E3B|nr:MULTISPECIES: VOC family protein [unclassified Novosphingobium]TCU59783.1 catechol 2,3-dioxygenase-like lactoylglutathione lyase family enzyme [Novosphingobium sp. PhB57]TDW63545.1 catechol 2,3-dioxygenase-like lactoylglutathione lyase family enzyme [Novosphingobium sp. PhB55]